MNRNQLNDTGMLNTVSSYMATNNSIWGGVPAMTATVAEVKANITRIDDKMGKQQTPTSGATDEKTQVRGDFEDQLLVIADQLSSLAAKNNDKNLGAQVDLNISTLDKLTTTNSRKRASGFPPSPRRTWRRWRPTALSRPTSRRSTRSSPSITG